MECGRACVMFLLLCVAKKVKARAEKKAAKRKAREEAQEAAQKELAGLQRAVIGRQNVPWNACDA